MSGITEELTTAVESWSLNILCDNLQNFNRLFFAYPIGNLNKHKMQLSASPGTQCQYTRISPSTSGVLISP